MANVLVVAAHPDDEILGCGGAMAKHAAAGDKVYTLILGEGLAARGGASDRDADRALKESARAAARELGAIEPAFADLPDNRLDSIELLDVVRLIESKLDEVKPAVIYTHWANDLNIDHRICCQAVITAARPLPGSGVRAIYFFEVPSATEWAAPNAAPPFVPTRFVDISAELPKKLRALDRYADEMRPFPHARSRESVEALARWRGASVGVAAAEAFVVGREIA
jgi:LmbE family N-acetylglucosaminyl deacetylase